MPATKQVSRVTKQQLLFVGVELVLCRDECHARANTTCSTTEYNNSSSNWSLIFPLILLLYTFETHLDWQARSTHARARITSVIHTHAPRARVMYTHVHTHGRSTQYDRPSVTETHALVTAVVYLVYYMQPVTTSTPSAVPQKKGSRAGSHETTNKIDSRLVFFVGFPIRWNGPVGMWLQASVVVLALWLLALASQL